MYNNESLNSEHDLILSEFAEEGYWIKYSNQVSHKVPLIVPISYVLI